MTEEIQTEKNLFDFGTFKDLEAILDKVIGVFASKVENGGENHYFYSENAFILSLIARKKEHLLACLEDDLQSFAERFEAMGKEFYRDKIPYIDFIKSFSTLKELLIETVADEKNHHHLIKEIYFLAKASLSYISKGYLMSMLGSDIHGIALLIEEEKDLALSEEEAGFRELLEWFYHLLLEIQKGEKAKILPLNRCDTFLMFKERSAANENKILFGEYLKDMHKRLHIDAQSILFYLEKDDYAGMLPVYSSLMNIYKVSLHLMHSHHMKQRLQIIENRAQEQGKLNQMLEESNNRLTQSEERLNTFFEASFDGILFHENGTILDINHAMVKISGYSRDEIIGRNVLEFIAPESRETVTAHLTAVNEETYEIYVTNKSGRMIPVEIRSKAIDFKGRMVRVASLHDITERKNADAALKKSEQYLQAIIENEPECVKLLDSRGKLISMNPAGLEMLQAETLEEAQQSPLTSYLLPKWRPHFIALHKKVMEGEGGSLEFEIQGLKGEHRWLETHAVPMRDLDGNIAALLGITRDVTQRKEKEEELFRHKENLEHLVEERTHELSEANQAKSIFLANMSHEIRTPINAIMGYNELLLKTELNEQQTNYLQKSKHASDALLSLISNILDLSMIDADKLRISKTIFPLREIVQQTAGMLQIEADKRGLSLTYEVDDSLCQFLIGDPERIRQVLINLIGNALKFTKAGSIHISVFVSSCSAQICTVEFAVSDTGIGIPNEKQKDIFDIFVQVDNSATRKERGTGLGLAICKHLIEAMGGSIEVESEEGEGSTFSFILPLDIPDISIILNKDQEYAFDFNDLRVLVVEDNEDNREVALKLLEHMGANVDIAHNGQVAIGMIREKSYDIVLMDIQMPVMDGLAATKIIRDEGFNTLPIIALSAHVTHEEQQRSLDAGMNVHLNKPFKISDLQNILLYYFPEKALKREGGATAQKKCWSDEFPEISGLVFNDELCGYWLKKEDFLQKLEPFIRNVRTESEHLHALIDKQDFPAAQKLLHKLKGSVKLYGAQRLFGAIEELEYGLGEGAQRDLIETIKEFDEAVFELVEGQTIEFHRTG